jgi:hypothetical protein
MTERQTEDPTLLGRDRELTALGRLLEAGGPAVVALVASPGMGKTAVLDAVEARAEARGWKVARRREERDVVVSEGSTPGAFVSQLHHLFDLPRSEPGDAAAGGASWASLATGSRAAGVTAMDDEISRLGCQISDLSPVLVLVDDCDPRPPFLDWFIELLRKVRGASERVVVVLAGLTGMEEALAGEVDLVLELGPIPEADVRRYLAQLWRDVDPPVGEAELAAYAAEATVRPAVLGRLTRLFALLESRTGGRSGGVEAAAG